MEIGIVGLGRMGAGIAERLLRAGHGVVGYVRHPASAAHLVARGVRLAESLPALVQQLAPPRAIWLMIPSGLPVDETIESLAPHLQPGDTLIDGGNSHYKDSQRRAAALAARGLAFLDVGTSGGIWGLEQGYCLMIGGPADAVERLRPVFQVLAPNPSEGWGRVGPSGAGHFVKMVHNGIEYGLMQAYAEGFAILGRKSELGLDLRQVADIWRSGSVVRSWLLDLLAAELTENPALEGIAPYVADSGEGRWTVAEAVDLDVPAPVITLALIERLTSRDEDSFSHRLLAALRRQFGGHAVKSEAQP